MTPMLAEPTGTPAAPLDPALAARLYARLHLIRRFEERLLDLFGEGKLVGTTHTCIGQEANAVGVVDHLVRGRDTIFSNHRCHGHYLAFTDDVTGLFAEVMGRSTGVCGGKGGSQHLCRDGFYSNGILGSIAPVATGIALAERRRGAGAVSTVFLGDGALGQGVVYESMNIASLWSLPLLIVVENNRYAQSTPFRLGIAGDVPARARAFGIETRELDSTDVAAVHAAAGDAVAYVREAGRPCCLVIETYRFSPHSKGDDDRDPAEIAARRLHDPLLIAGRALDDDARRALEEANERRLDAAAAEAEAAPIAGGEGG